MSNINRNCNTCNNYTENFNADVDNGCYLCSKGIEDNYEEKKDSAEVEKSHVELPSPEYILNYVRRNLGLDENDTSKDAIILEMDKSEIFSRVCNWKGLIYYGEAIKGWIEDIYHVKLDGEHKNFYNKE